MNSASTYLQITSTLPKIVRLYDELACPFEDDTSKGHPLCAKFPDGFLTNDFSFDKVASRLTDDTMIYIFYNVMDEGLQRYAAKQLYSLSLILSMQKGVKYNKNARVWVRKLDGKFEYFDINQWQYLEYTGDTGPEHFCSDSDFDQK